MFFEEINNCLCWLKIFFKDLDFFVEKLTFVNNKLIAQKINKILNSPFIQNIISIMFLIQFFLKMEI